MCGVYLRWVGASNECSYMTYECCDDEFNVSCAPMRIVVLPCDIIFWFRKLRGPNRIPIDFTREPIVYTDILYGLWYLPTTTLNWPYIVYELYSDYEEMSFVSFGNQCFASLN